MRAIRDLYSKDCLGVGADPREKEPLVRNGVGYWRINTCEREDAPEGQRRMHLYARGSPCVANIQMRFGYESRMDRFLPSGAAHPTVLTMDRSIAHKQKGTDPKGTDVVHAAVGSGPGERSEDLMRGAPPQ